MSKGRTKHPELPNIYADKLSDYQKKRKFSCKSKIAIEQIIPSQSQERLFVEEINPDCNKPNESLFLQPVFLHHACDGFTILYGFNYISNVYQRGGKNIQAFVIPKSQPLFSALNIVADFIRRSRPLWPIEVARILQLFNQQQFSNAKKSAFLKIYRERFDPYSEEQYLALIGLNPLLHKFLIEKSATENLVFNG